MKRIKTLFLIFLFFLGGILIFSSSPVMSGGISIWPGKLTISMPEGYPDEEIRYEVEVTNKNSFDIDVRVEIENPSIDEFKEGYTFMPNLSWISVSNDTLHISESESEIIEVIIEIPHDKKPLYYDEHWEVRLVISEASQGGLIKLELASRLFINTPSLTLDEGISVLLVIFLIIVGSIVIVFIFYTKRKKIQQQ